MHVPAQAVELGNDVGAACLRAAVRRGDSPARLGHGFENRRQRIIAKRPFLGG
jgi:hypothetical protein